MDNAEVVTELARRFQAERMFRQSAWFGAHLGDRIIDESPRRQNDQSPTSADNARITM